MPGLADRLNQLFRTVLRPGTDELWNNETAAWEISRTGPPVSAAYLSQLRTGKRSNPSARHLAALAGIFQVPMESFFAREVPAGPTPGGATDPGMLRMLRLLYGISPAGLAGIEHTISDVRAHEELPSPPVAAGPASAGEAAAEAAEKSVVSESSLR